MSFHWKSYKQKGKDAENVELIQTTGAQRIQKKTVGEQPYSTQNPIYAAIPSPREANAKPNPAMATQQQTKTVPTTNPQVIQYVPYGNTQIGTMGYANGVVNNSSTAHLVGAMYGQNVQTNPMTPGGNQWYNGMPVRWNAKHNYNPSSKTETSKTQIYNPSSKKATSQTRQTKGAQRKFNLRKLVCTKNTRLIVGLLAVVMFIIVVVAVGIYLAEQSKYTINKATLKTSIHLTAAEYVSNYANTTSTAFRQFAKDFCANVDGTLKKGTVGGYIGCTVTKLSNGSVIVESDVVYDEKNLDVYQVNDILKTIKDKVKVDEYGPIEANGQWDIQSLNSENRQLVLSATTTVSTTTTASTTTTEPTTTQVISNDTTQAEVDAESTIADTSTTPTTPTTTETTTPITTPTTTPTTTTTTTPTTTSTTTLTTTQTTTPTTTTATTPTTTSTTNSTATLTTTPTLIVTVPPTTTTTTKTSTTTLTTKTTTTPTTTLTTTAPTETSTRTTTSTTTPTMTSMTTSTTQKMTQSSSTTSSTSTQTTTTTIPTSTKTTTLTSTSTTTTATPPTTNQTTMSTNPTTQSIPSTSSTTPSTTTPAVTINPADTCETITCLNGGTCNDIGTPVVCNCLDGFEGNLCERNIDECASNPCQYDGTCVDMVNGYTCQCAKCGCADIEAGTNCETDVSGCRGQEAGFFYHPDSCSQYIQCENSILYTKTCADGLVFYTGDNPRCDNPSPDHTCAQTTTAAPTTTTRQPCEESQCVHGSCSTSDITTCECDIGYIGDNCEIERILCVDLNCMNGGTCNDTVDTVHAFCQCTELYTGNQCQTEKDPCNPDPCKNGAQCVRGVGIEYTCMCGYSCQCANEFNKNCTYDVQECTNVPNGNYPHPTNCSWYVSCNNNVRKDVDCNTNPNNTDVLVYDHSLGICNFKRNVQCASSDPPPTTPPTITRAVCAESQCINGNCSTIDPTVCDCLPDYLGEFCEEPRITCEDIVCENGGTCDDSDSAVHAFCNCPGQYTGSNCESEYHPCDDGPCLNGGQCQPVIGSDYEYICHCTYNCSCANRDAGSNCEIDMTTCEGKQNGVHPYGNDCTKFMNCFEGNTFITACSGEQVFNPAGYCDSPDNVACYTP